MTIENTLLLEIMAGVIFACLAFLFKFCLNIKDRSATKKDVERGLNYIEKNVDLKLRAMEQRLLDKRHTIHQYPPTEKKK